MRILSTWLASWSPSREGWGAIVLRAGVYLLMGLAVFILIAAEKPWVHAEKIAELREKGAKLDLRHHVSAGLFYGSIINLALGAVVLFLRRFWCRGLGERAEAPIRQAAGTSPRVFWIGIGVAVLLAGGMRWQLAKGSLWWDELWNIKHTMSGEFRPDKKKGGELKFREASWEKATFYYRKPTNHPPMALASRISLGVWRKLTGADRSEFNEVAARMPSILAGLLSVVGIGVLVRSWGFGAGGIVAALLLAIHPWHIRYGIDARAYSFAVLWTILGCLWLSGIFRSGGGRWRYWILFGLNQLLFVWTLPNGIYYAFGFGLAALAFCFTRTRGDQRWTALARVVAVNIVAAMSFVFLFLPNALQISEWGKVNDHHYLSGDVLLNVASQLSFGLQNQWGGSSIENQGLTSFVDSMASHAVSGWLAILCLVTVAGFGAGGLLRDGRDRRPVLFAVLFGAGLSLLVTWALQQHFYHRYVVSYLIVPFVAAVGVGCVELVRVAKLKQAWAVVIPALVVLATYFMFTSKQRSVLNSRSYAPFREVADYLDGIQKSSDPINVIGYGLGGRVFCIYYPEGKFADTLEELEDELANAEERGGAVYVVHGYRQFNRIDEKSKLGSARLDDAAQFEELEDWGGIEPLFHFVVLRKR